MTPELKSIWVEALRSGQFLQGQTRLRSVDNTFCCLGVLCELRGSVWVFPPGDDDGSGFVCGDGHPDVSDQFPAVKFLDTVGLTYDAAARLVELNDNGKSFAQIADFIEKNL